MGRKEGVRIVAVVEDRQLEGFVRKTLAAFGFDRNKIRVLRDYPKSGSGSGKHYVDQAYRKEIVTLRQKRRENKALLLGTEADEQTVDARIQILDDAVSATGRPRRGENERIVYWIPKRHVETWGLHLTGTLVDEATNYKKEATRVDWSEAGRNFVREYQESKREQIETLDSLRRAYGETGRLNI